MLNETLNYIFEVLATLFKYIVVIYLGIAGLIIVVGNYFYSKRSVETNAHGL